MSRDISLGRTYFAHTVDLVPPAVTTTKDSYEGYHRSQISHSYLRTYHDKFGRFRDTPLGPLLPVDIVRLATLALPSTKYMVGFVVRR